ncbi:MAG: ABC transporter ATP-binding protein/permease [Clostridiales bacterium]|jgi:ATP-binding cassette subfamily B protein|nr:ABC transporter ATP-binding protein/permease [Clostridiales bacterium]
MRKSTDVPEEPEDRLNEKKADGYEMISGDGPNPVTSAKAKDAKKVLKRLLYYLRPQRSRLVLVFIFALISVCLTIAGPKIMAVSINELQRGTISLQLAKVFPIGTPVDQVVSALKADGRDNLAEMVENQNIKPGIPINLAFVGKILLILLGMYLLSSFFSWLQQFLMAGISMKTVYALRRDADRKLSRLPLEYFDNNTRGEVLSRITNDIDNIAASLSQSLTQLITTMLSLLGILIIMFTIDLFLALISLIVLPACALVTLLITKRSQKHFREQWASTGRLNGQIEEVYTGHDLVKVFGRQQAVIETFDRENEILYLSGRKAIFLSGIIWPVMNYINNLNYVAICVLGGIRALSGQIGLGEVIAFIQYSRQFNQPIIQMASIINILQSTIASAERVFELLDEEEEVPGAEQELDRDAVKGHISFKNVSFRYCPDLPLIENLNLEIRPGKTVAIVGPTGAGKTTLVNLLMRFYELNGGSIEIDGVDIKEYSKESLRAAFGMVLQDTWSFSGSISDNIAYGAVKASREEIKEAARMANIDYYITALAEGYDTRLNDDASNISQGQKQLICIARAFLADPKLLILDEATSSVDTRTEIMIQKAMARLMEGKTSFIIAHRLSTIREADLILVMNEGQIVEQGNHRELLTQNGFYADLYHSQRPEARG